MNITLRQLRVFIAVARQRSFSRAGDAIGLSQPAVSHAIRELESELRLKLIDRTTRDMALTEAGAALAVALARQLEELDATLVEARSQGEQRHGKVRVASSPTLSAHLMPACIEESRRRYPQVTLILRDQVQNLVLAGIRNGEVDFGVIVDPLDADDLYCEPIRHEPFYLVCRDDHPLAAQPCVAWTALEQQRLVMLDYASGSRPLIDRALQQQHVRGDVVQELGHLTTVYRMIEAGIGISVVPEMALPSADNARLASRPLTPPIERTIMLARRRHRSLSPQATAIWSVIGELACGRRDTIGGCRLSG
ncbi:LysR family transcriptional regulator [Paludibacterium yongneupense]|uniref:LysR family transcriptional regulator n=1 Tax=Paludibacterium yongneupense TaxID=400061 RepID=UPI000414F5AB|nr:LysR family transcriptional regulator [Paludibacterium yongneupense]